MIGQGCVHSVGVGNVGVSRASGFSWPHESFKTTVGLYQVLLSSIYHEASAQHVSLGVLTDYVGGFARFDPVDTEMALGSPHCEALAEHVPNPYAVQAGNKNKRRLQEMHHIASQVSSVEIAFEAARWSAGLT